jgi:endonuclease/exonuclease/phosphatase (EEP) superfamily protein YafD
MNTFLQRVKYLGRHFVLAGLWLLAVGFLALYPLRWLSGDHLYGVRVLNYVLPWLLILLLPAAGLAFFRRHTRLGLLLLLPTLLISTDIAPLFLPHQKVYAAAENLTLKVMSYNLFYRADISPDILTLIEQEQPDVLLLQEVNPALPALSEELPAGWYSDVVVESEARFSAAVLSRYPITRLAAEYDKGRTQKVRLETPTGPIQVWNVHPLPPYIFAPERQDRQIGLLTADIAQVTGPLIVAGDFNVTFQAANYTLISKHLNNAHQTSGWGFGFTFPAFPHRKGLPFAPGPLYRIDHIFYNKDFIARRSEVLVGSGLSDHLPILAELVLIPVP